MNYTIHHGDCLTVLRTLADGSAQTCVTSPPYFGLRDYGHEDQIGLEQTPDAYVAKLVDVFREVRRVLRDDGTVWLNLGDSYSVKSTYNAAQSLHTDNDWKQAGESKNTACYERTCGVPAKNLLGIPWRVAFALQADGWYLRQDIIWYKPNPMPESVTDRCTKAHEYVFLLSKSARYYFDGEAIKEPAVGGLAGNTKPTKAGRAYETGAAEHRTAAGLHKWAERQRLRGQDSTNESFVPGATPHGGLHRAGTEREPEMRNRRSVWTVASKPYAGAHFATYPPALIEPCILAGCPVGGTVLDPFTGSGTTAVVALNNRRAFVGAELNPDYIALAHERIRTEAGQLCAL